ncbi:unnamed protein product [Rangifer tarandus platyrhynchus]|uniref:Uncharacterized protein n=2 Tax=Rangifer tarandus platyrhynchus TaxID=3082113 RepID=A0ACB0E8Z6_RANTA|nr:unnamed protein product [Rangifer tarandus platyrhynchus]CAI9696919.1 unnamed protein product [Rangifer tarandus platyrhynchus]
MGGLALRVPSCNAGRRVEPAHPPCGRSAHLGAGFQSAPDVSPGAWARRGLWSGRWWRVARRECGARNRGRRSAVHTAFHADERRKNTK